VRRTHTEHESHSIGLNLTPLIDMVFILLIFFIVTSSFVKESGLRVDRPSAKTAVRQERGNIVVGIDKDGNVWIARQQVDVRSVRARIERLKAENPQGEVIIAADRAARTGVLVQVMDQVRLAGVSNVAIAAARPGARSP
jgi:biopolymer transport protein ExbD